MPTRKISDMPLLAQGDLVPSGDYLPIVDISEASASNRNKRILANSLAMGSQFTQSGTSAVARTVENKLRDALSAKDFGAVGDGVADDTAALQAAIVAAEAVGQGALHIPGGVYRTTAQLRIRRPIKLFGNGAGQGDNSVNQRGSLILCEATAGNAAILVQPDATAAIWGLIIRDIGINGSTLADGIVLSAINGQTISQSAFENLVIRSCRDGIRGSGTTAAGIYQNEFRNIKIVDARRAGFDVQDGSYNQVTNVEATMNVAATGYGIRIETTGTHVADVMTEGPVRLNMPYGTVTGLHCENLVPTTPAGSGNLIALIGTNLSLRNVSIVNIDHTKADYGLVVFSERCTIDNVFVTGTDGPRYMWNPQSGSSGTLANVRVQTTRYTAEQAGFTTAQIYDNWRYVNASGAEGVVNVSEAFVQSGTGAVARTVENKLRDVISVKDFGAVGDGVADDTAEIQAALTAAAGKALYIPAGVYKITSPLTYSTGTNPNGSDWKPIKIYGDGAGSELRISGSAARALHITGLVGVTLSRVELESFQVRSETATACTDGILLDGVAIYSICDVNIYTPEQKIITGIRLKGTQQGELHGGMTYQCQDGIKFELDPGSASNGCDLHGHSFYNTARNLVVDGVDSLFCHDNHFVVAPVAIDITAGGFGPAFIVNNHIELHSTAGVRSVATAHVINNIFFTASGGTDVLFTGGAPKIHNNVLNGNTSIGASCEDASICFNWMLGTGSVTNNGTRTTMLGNFGQSASSRLGRLQTKMRIESADLTAGDILDLQANPVIGGDWGMRIAGAGASTNTYLRLQNTYITGNTGNSEIAIQGTLGTDWVRFFSNGIQLPEVAAPANTPANTARLFVRDNGSGKTQLCVIFPTGAVQVISTEP